MPPPFWTIGCLYGASSVMLGAFGAHGLKKRIADPQRLTNWGTAAQYQVLLLSRHFCPHTISLTSSLPSITPMRIVRTPLTYLLL